MRAMSNVRLSPTATPPRAALARLDDGRVVLVDGAVPVDVVEARVVEDNRDFARAAVGGVLEPSPDWVVPPCAGLAAGGGGCT